MCGCHSSLLIVGASPKSTLNGSTWHKIVRWQVANETIRQETITPARYSRAAVVLGGKRARGIKHFAHPPERVDFLSLDRHERTQGRLRSEVQKAK